ncbi:NAD(P)-binding domain-containing protein [Panacibacter sp. DH6]|uniref:Glycerol-3-phosphate dehydrogenase n=1 Tax=Panacibacter microcysteis TaxID=2793269 RepID=A0A931GYK3_9BACT|nr:NAD(P)H-dependent glycerol-3-phosphate dehydrogenase [Panacibacter microcysteis]MBG9376452.1 NAD(P)-binding domain-containing protein [Panacibacter microcysteis]
MLTHVAVLGSGSWATALVKIFAESGVFVSWHVRTQDQADDINANGRNPRYLSFAELKMSFINAYAAVEQTVAHAEMVIFAMPAAYLPDYIKNIDKSLFDGKTVAVSIKGLIPGTSTIPGLYLEQQLAKKNVAVIAGPCHAEEVATQSTTYMTISCNDETIATTIASSIKTGYVTTIINNDPAGVEYAAILKNIIGIAGGIAKGLQFGHNFRAVLVSNAMREVQQFMTAIVPRSRDLFDSVYFGDLLVTAYSDFSRNRTLGKLVGRGMKPVNALDAMEMVAEGYQASKELAPVIEKAQLNLPVINGVYRILHQHANPYYQFMLIEKHLR